MSDDKKDLTPGEFPRELKWSEGEAAKSLEELYKFVNQECERAIKWYFAKKRWKRILGYTLRVAAICLIAISGIIPILATITEDKAGVPAIAPGWASLALALAALCITLDKFSGFTSGWIRFVNAGQALSNLQSVFRVDWECMRLTGDGPGQPGPAIACCRDFLEEVNAIVSNETKEWAREFQKVLARIEEGTKAKE